MPASSYASSSTTEAFPKFAPISIDSVAPLSPPTSPRALPVQASSLARLFAEMVSFLWFQLPEVGMNQVSKHQLIPSERFLSFCHLTLSTTQVSHSVVLLALLFIFRLKQKNPSISGAHGSEFRLATTALMLANKVLDDNTYTAKTWAEVSSLDLRPLVAGEAEFLRGLDFNLHCKEEDFRSWQKLLRELGIARSSHLFDSSTTRRAPIKRTRPEDGTTRNGFSSTANSMLAPGSKTFTSYALPTAPDSTIALHSLPVSRQLRPRPLNISALIPPPTLSQRPPSYFGTSLPPATRSSTKRSASPIFDSVPPPPKRQTTEISSQRSNYNYSIPVPFPYQQLSPSFPPSEQYGIPVQFQHLATAFSPTSSGSQRSHPLGFYSLAGGQRPGGISRAIYRNGMPSSVGRNGLPASLSPHTLTRLQQTYRADYSPAGSINSNQNRAISNSNVSFSQYSNAGLPAINRSPYYSYETGRTPVQVPPQYGNRNF